MKNGENFHHGPICAGFPAQAPVRPGQTALMLLLFAALSFAEVNISVCGEISGSNQNYTLNQSISGLISGQGACLNITAANITLDCRGFSITGNRTGIGIYSGWLENSAIRNCTVSNYSTGIYVIANSSLLSNLTVCNNNNTNIDIYFEENFTLRSLDIYGSQTGIFANALSDLRIYDSRVHNHSNAGVYANTCGIDGLSVSNVTFYANKYGFYDLWSLYSSITGSVFYNNTYGIYLDGAESFFVSSTSLYNNSYGILLMGAGGPPYGGGSFNSITTNNNTNYGFYFGEPYEWWGSVDNSISNSVSCGNGAGGYYFSEYSTGNTGSNNQGNITDLDSNTGFSSGACTAPPASSPSVALNSPAGGALLGTSQVTLNWTPYNFTSNPTCNATSNSTIIFSATCTNNMSCATANATSDGIYLWNVTCYAGSESSTSGTRSFSVDTAAPALTVQSPANSTYGSSNISVSYIASDPTSGTDKCWYSLDTGANATLAGCANATISAGNGPHTLTVYANDSTGHSNSSSVSFSVDLVQPGLSFVPPTPANNSYQRERWVYVNVSSSENLNQSILEWNGTNESMGVSGSMAFRNKTNLSDGTYSYRVFAQDLAGNWNSTPLRSVRIGPITQLTFAIRNHILIPLYLTGIELDSNTVVFDPPVHFAPGAREVVSFNISAMLCAAGQLVQFENVTLRYNQGAMQNNTQRGFLPIVVKCS